MYRSRKRWLWLVSALLLMTALWALDVEITYERNTRHIPAGFRMQHHPVAHRWKA